MYIVYYRKLQSTDSDIIFTPLIYFADDIWLWMLEMYNGYIVLLL